MGKTEGKQTIGSIAIQRANEYVPEIIACKLQQVASENNVQTFELLLERELSPLWDQMFLLPRNSRAWFYDGGRFWLLMSDGDLFVEPIMSTIGVGPSLPEIGETVWSITLDDAAEHPRVSQCVLSTLGQNEAVKREAIESDTTQSSESRVALTCAQCGEMAGLEWLLKSANQQEAEEKIRFLLGYGCSECRSQDGADPVAYADRHLLRLIESFLFMHLHSTEDRIALLLAVGDAVHALQREILNLPEW